MEQLSTCISRSMSACAVTFLWGQQDLAHLYVYCTYAHTVRAVVRHEAFDKAMGHGQQFRMPLLA